MVDILPVTIRTVSEGGHTVRFVEIDGPIPIHWWTPRPRPRNRLNPVNDVEVSDPGQMTGSVQ